MKRFEYALIVGVTALVMIVWHVIPFESARLGMLPAAAQTEAEEIRGVWMTNVDSEVMFSREGLEGALDTLATHHFNTVYPAVWSWGYTLYPSAVAAAATGHEKGLYPDLEAEGRNEALEATQGDRDMLQELVDMAHARHLSVIPWFEFSFMAPANSTLAARHPDWLTQKQGGGASSKLWQEGRHTRVWLNPFHPEVQQFILEMIAELMANYDVEGLQLDDHFGLPVEFGYDPVTIELYRREHWGQAPPRDPNNREWVRWRADKLTAFLEQIFRTVKAQNPKAVLSLSPNPMPFAYNHHLADWPQWWQDGYVEELIVQVYRDGVNSFVETLRSPTLTAAKRHIPTAIGVLSGLKSKYVSTELIRQQVEAARSHGFDGVSFFFHDTLWRPEPDGATVRYGMIRNLFPGPMARPAVVANR